MTDPLHQTVATRVSRDVARKIEKFRARLAKDRPGERINQSDALRVLLQNALRAEGL